MTLGDVIDDVTAHTPDHSYIYKQVKFSTNPQAPKDPYNWKTFLHKDKGSTGKFLPSLLEKWSSSLRNLSQDQKIKNASLISNRMPAPDVLVALNPDGLIDLDKIADHDTRDTIIQQIGGEAEARKFFSEFHFNFNEPNLNELEEGLRRRFFRLGGNELGWHELKSSVGDWVIYKNLPVPDGKITLGEVKRAAQWNELKSLPQDFIVPLDYVLPSEDFHKSVIDKLESLNQGCLVMAASPGMGKSTYASFLYKDLTDKDVPVVRHHYFLALSDRFSSTRLDHFVAAESLMHDLLYNHPEALEGIGNKNPNPHELREWVEACGAYYTQQSKSLIIIIDGLDHVWREKRSIGELEKLLGFLLPPIPGVIIFLATQPVTDDKLPPLLLRAAPRNQWLTLPFLDKSAVRRWLELHRNEMTYPGRGEVADFQISDLAEIFFVKSSGHPLYLHYSLRAIQEQNLGFTEQTIRALPGCPHADIISYYQELWLALSEDSREILYLMCSCRFPWPKDGLLDCLDPERNQLPKILDAIKKVQHLLISDDFGLKPFHSSLLTFIESQEDYSLYEKGQRGKALKWLQKAAPAYWKWAFEWLLEAQIGNISPLLSGPTRNWAVEALALRRPYNNTVEILSETIKQALVLELLPRAIEIGLLLDYVNTAFDFHKSIFEKLLYPQLKINSDHFFRASLFVNIGDLSYGEVALLAEAESLQSKLEGVQRCYKELIRRARNYDVHYLDGDRLTWREQYEPILKIAALRKDVPSNIVDLVIRNRDTELNLKLLTIFCEQLRIYKRIGQLKYLLGLETNPPTSNNTEGEESEAEAPDTETVEFDRSSFIQEELSVILRNTVLLAFEEGLEIDAVFCQRVENNDPFSIIYSFVHKLDITTVGDIAFPPSDVFSYQGTDFEENRIDLENFYYQCFFRFLANHLKNSGNRNKEWILAPSIHQWPLQFLHKLNEIAEEICIKLKSTEVYSLEVFYNQLKTHKRPKWPFEEDRLTIAGYNETAMAATNNIGLDLLVILKANGNIEVPSISETDFKAMISSDYLVLENWLNIYVSRRRKYLTEAGVTEILTLQQHQLSSSIDNFTSRASLYATLSGLAALHEINEVAAFLISKACENLLAHNYHKDMLFFGVLDSIQILQKSFYQDKVFENVQEVYPPTRNLLFQIAPAIAKIEEYTDSDETNHLPRKLAEVLGDVGLDLVPLYYRWLASKEEFSDATATLHVFLEKADLSDPLNLAIAATATDRESFVELDNRSQSGNSDATVALSKLQEILGPNALDSDREKEYESNKGSSIRTTDEELPDISLFAPERFEEYLTELGIKKIILNFDKAVIDWIDYWSEAGKKDEVYVVLGQFIERGFYFRQLDIMYTLASKLYGKDPAYKWLVTAHSEDYGWQNYFTDKSRAIKRWEIVKQIYPEKWFEFIRDTLLNTDRGSGIGIGSHMLARLTEYCLFMGQPDLTKRIVDQMVSSSLELVSPLSLPIPTWVEEAKSETVDQEEDKGSESVN